ncbi:hypothetical protein SAMN05216490_0842 [Mucilaginibacter mallensis]|uniref:LiaF transmembrane domain-containing protein n=1 Tax=Mucilaginibacter mallensis TaxID=652787 RepID=A0A1H1QUC2_MUCMA|nr:DUF5668 domain-containing protein [Mucilaginibacter mallensis]SDS26469.1 hypothetical protein SAMN05216490_0842 [Mucilaginibacter mallensis]
MENQINNPQPAHNAKTTTGMIFLVIGLALLFKHIGFFLFPHWLFSWPLILIIFGLYVGAKHNFKKTNWIIYVMLGVIFLLPNIIPALGAGTIWPLLLIAFGVHQIMRHDQRWNGAHWEKRNDSTTGNINNI